MNKRTFDRACEELIELFGDAGFDLELGEPSEYQTESGRHLEREAKISITGPFGLVLDLCGMIVFVRDADRIQFRMSHHGQYFWHDYDPKRGWPAKLYWGR